jgi:hypothetical protein
VPEISDKAEMLVIPEITTGADFTFGRTRQPLKTEIGKEQES